MIKILGVGIPDLDVNINTNNHEVDWTYGKILSSEERRYFISQSNREAWGHLNPYPSWMIEFDASIMLELTNIGSIVHRRPTIHIEEMDKLQAQIQEVMNQNPRDAYFIRCDQCSPKDGKYQMKVLSAKEAVDTLVTSTRINVRCHNSSPLKIYLQPWSDEWETLGVEYRVFLFQGKVTAISQYHCYTLDSKLQVPENIHQNYAERIVDKCNQIRDQLGNQTNQNWVIDLILMPDRVDLVEVNTFGAELPAGSGLFEWILDREILYGDGSLIEYRYIKN